MANSRGNETRARILAVLDAADGALGAYAIAERLKRPDARIAPMTVYRALDALVADGRVHRVESANAYVSCRHGTHRATPPVLAICDACGCVEEHAASGALDALVAEVGREGFAARRLVTEVHGRCGDCREDPSSN